MSASVTSSTCPQSVWCVVANVVEERTLKTGETYNGTRLFRGNAKVYLASLKNSWEILPRARRDEREQIKVIGQHRQSRQWITCWIRINYLTNWRIQVVHKPGAVERLWHAGWLGFKLAENEFTYDGDRDSPEAVKRLLSIVRKKAEDAPKKTWWQFWR